MAFNCENAMIQFLIGMLVDGYEVHNNIKVNIKYSITMCFSTSEENNSYTLEYFGIVSKVNALKCKCVSVVIRQIPLHIFCKKDTSVSVFY